MYVSVNGGVEIMVCVCVSECWCGDCGVCVSTTAGVEVIVYVCQ